MVWERRVKIGTASSPICRDSQPGADGFGAPNGVGHLGRPLRYAFSRDNSAGERRMMEN